jgi:hypothetical protein
VNKDEHTTPYFSITEGGFLNFFFRKMKMKNKQFKEILVLLSITWIPLLLISIYEGNFISGQESFLKDISMQVRLLIAIPMLVIIKKTIDEKVIMVLKYIATTLIHEEDRITVYKPLVKKTNKLMQSKWIEILFLLVIIVLTFSSTSGGILSGNHSGTESWITRIKEGKEVLSFAGIWADYISIPCFQFLLISWLWRYLIWVFFLFRISQLNLKLLPTHPDQAGGLGIILLAQNSFALFFVAISFTISGEFSEQLLKFPNSFLDIRNQSVGFIVLCLIMILIPMAFFVWKLINLKHEGLIKLSSAGATLSQKFEENYIEGIADQKVVPSINENPSTVYDYSSLFVTLENLRYIPLSIKDVIGIFVLVLLPYLPILIIHYSILELIDTLISILM